MDPKGGGVRRGTRQLSRRKGMGSSDRAGTAPSVLSTSLPECDDARVFTAGQRTMTVSEYEKTFYLSKYCLPLVEEEGKKCHLFTIGLKASIRVRDYLREAVTVLDHRVAAIMEATDLDSVPVEVLAKVVVLETALGLVQPEVLEDNCCQDLAGGVAPNVSGVVGTIPGLASRALLDAITVDSLDLFERIARCPLSIERSQQHRLQKQVCKVDYRRYHSLWRLCPVVGPDQCSQSRQQSAEGAW
ncbi:hypothetical protein L3X38_032550 [Prunus dulcis]|uniref:Retrotransposon gag domain-containing protein n=1 Tax=Prunus dulcis TaxID=3755 RepID=A0AAD4VEK2_PRUDU|nr:hypothetical protein L3X38_032550 [Prunus dulcis]